MFWMVTHSSINENRSSKDVSRAFHLRQRGTLWGSYGLLGYNVCPVLVKNDQGDKWFTKQRIRSFNIPKWKLCNNSKVNLEYTSAVYPLGTVQKTRISPLAVDQPNTLFTLGWSLLLISHNANQLRYGRLLRTRSSCVNHQRFLSGLEQNNRPWAGRISTGRPLSHTHVSSTWRDHRPGNVKSLWCNKRKHVPCSPFCHRSPDSITLTFE